MNNPIRMHKMQAKQDFKNYEFYLLLTQFVIAFNEFLQISSIHILKK